MLWGPRQIAHSLNFIIQKRERRKIIWLYYSRGVVIRTKLEFIELVSARHRAAGERN